MRLLTPLLLGLLAAPALAQHGTVVSREDRQLVVRLNDDVTVLAPDLGNVMVPETGQTSAQVIVNAVRGNLAECTIMAESSHPPRAGYPVWFDRPALQGSLEITSEPPDAAVTLNGMRSGRTPANELLAAGSYRIGLTRAGYQPDSAVVTVVAGQAATHHRRLVPLTEAPPPDERPPAEGVRFILTSTPGQARILIDGEPRGFTPQEGSPPRVIDLPVAARYAVEIRLEKHLSQFDTLTVEPGQVWAEHYTLEEKRAPVSVLVYPWGSEVFLDGAPVGRTPYAGTLPWGYHAVRVERPGFVPLVRDSVFVWGIRSQHGTAMASIVEAELQRGAGWLRVRTGTPGLQVRLDGVAVGKTPLDLLVPLGSYDLLIEDEGVPRHQERVAVGAQDDVEVRIGTPP